MKNQKKVPKLTNGFTPRSTREKEREICGLQREGVKETMKKGGMEELNRQTAVDKS